MEISQTILSIGLLVIYCIFVAISIINIHRLNKQQEESNREQINLFLKMTKLNSSLTCQILEIKTIIDESDKSKELYKETIDKIKKVIYPKHDTEIDNF